MEVETNVYLPLFVLFNWNSLLSVILWFGGNGKRVGKIVCTGGTFFCQSLFRSVGNLSWLLMHNAFSCLWNSSIIEKCVLLVPISKQLIDNSLMQFHWDSEPKKSISSFSFGKVSWISQTSVSKKKHLARSRIIHLLSNIFLPNELDRGGCYNKGVGFLCQGQYYIVFRYSLLIFWRNIFFLG